MMKKSLLMILFIGVAFCLESLSQYQGRVEGIAVDPEGNPLEKVEVTIISQKVPTARFELTTDKHGRFVQIGLFPGYYQVNFKKTGFAPQSVEVKVSIAEATKIEVKLEPAEAAAALAYSEADKLFLKGNKLYAESKFAEAAAAYEEAIQLNPAQWAYQMNLGLALKKMERTEEARAAFAKALELNPASFSAAKEMAEGLARAGNFEEAKKYFKKAVELSPDDPDAFYNLGVSLVNTGESEAALDAFLKCVQINPDYADAYFQIGTLFVGQNKVKEALENLERFLELAPNHEKAAVARQLVEFLKKSGLTL
ncbi:MAG: tetratricopeptide repeat protein [Clostridiales bacterium]|nr:tetratricopeptide repeat protein [Clostridiales bacterium]